MPFTIGQVFEEIRAALELMVVVACKDRNTSPFAGIDFVIGLHRDCDSEAAIARL